MIPTPLFPLPRGFAFRPGDHGPVFRKARLVHVLRSTSSARGGRLRPALGFAGRPSGPRLLLSAGCADDLQGEMGGCASFPAGTYQEALREFQEASYADLHPDTYYIWRPPTTAWAWPNRARLPGQPTVLPHVPRPDGNHTTAIGAGGDAGGAGTHQRPRRVCSRDGSARPDSPDAQMNWLAATEFATA